MLYRLSSSFPLDRVVRFSALVDSMRHEEQFPRCCNARNFLGFSFRLEPVIHRLGGGIESDWGQTFILRISSSHERVSR